MDKFKKCRNCGGLDEYIWTKDGVETWFCADCNTERLTGFLEIETSEQRARDRIGE